MASMARTGLMSVVLVAAAAIVFCWSPRLDPDSLAEAIALGQSRTDAARARLHATYHVAVGHSPIDYIEIVTPFRRVVLEAEARRRAGERLFGQREALETLGSDATKLDIVVEMTFHPLNTFVRVPEYDAALLADDRSIMPTSVARIPRFGPRLPGDALVYPYSAGGTVPNATQPLLGGRLVASFDGAALEDRSSYRLAILDQKSEVARVSIDLAALR